MQISTVKLVRKTLLAVLSGTLIFAILFLKIFHIPWLGFTFAVLAILMIIGYLIFSILYWRCPSCGKLLPEKQINTQYCPRCGEFLD